jgi:hypothetical protein
MEKWKVENRKRRTVMKRGAFFFLLLYCSSVLFSTPLWASTGCGYPASLDSWTDKSTGDFLTVADVNQFRCGIEKLMTGPIRPNKGSASAPAYSFQGDTSTGFDSLAANTGSFMTAGVERIRFGSGGFTTGIWAATPVATQYGGLGLDLSATAQGNTLYFSAAGVVAALPPGTSGQMLKTLGAAANPAWADADIVLVKAADETVASSTALQNDDHLFYAAAANTSYQVMLRLLISSTSAVPDFKIDFALPASATIFWDPTADGVGGGGDASSGWGPVTVGTTPAALTLAGAARSFGTGNLTNGLLIFGVVRIAGTPGNIQLRWAQDTSNAAGVTLLKDSTMTVRRLQ